MKHNFRLYKTVIFVIGVVVKSIACIQSCGMWGGGGGVGGRKCYKFSSHGNHNFAVLISKTTILN